MGLETATIIAIVSAVVSVGTAVYAMNQASDETNAGTAVTKQGSQNSRNKVYGKAIVGTTRVYSNVKDRDQSYRTDVFDVGGIGTLRFHNVWIEDKKMFEEDKSILTYPLSATNGTFDSSFMRDTYKKSEEFKVQFRSGHDNQVAANLARLNSDGEWTSAHKGANVPHLVIYADYTTDQDYVMFSDNYNVKVLVSSEDLYDPRTGQFNGDSSNPALAIRDYLTSTYYGLSITPDYIDDESIIVAANLCEFYGLEINTAIDGGASFSDVLNDMLSTFGGALTIHQGKIQILFEDSVDAPLYEFNSDNILKGSFTVTPTSSSGYCNVVTATFKSGINGEKSDDYVIPADTLNDPRIIEDGSIQSKTFDMPYTVDAYEEDNGVVSRAVKFRANREYKRALFQTTCSFDVDLLEYPLLNIWSVISLSDPIYGFENKLFRVQSMVSSTDEKGLNIATLTLIEYDESVYLTDIDGSSVSIPLPIRSDVISPPTGVTFNVESFITNGYGVLKWYAGSYTGATGYDVEYRISTEGNTNAWVRLVSGHSTESYDIYGLKNSSYDFRVRTNDSVLGTSVWVELTAEEVTTPYSLPSVTSLAVDSSSKDFVLSWDDMSSTVITNKTDDTNPNSADSTGTLGDVLSHYLIEVYSGSTLKGSFTTSESTFVYMHAENAKTTLTRTLNFQVSIVDKSGNVSGVESVNGSNVQEDKPTAVTVTNTNGNSTIEWLPVLSPDFAGTVICVNESEDFTPAVDDIVTTLGQESFYVYNYDPADITDRYVKIAHFDSFGNDSLKYSDAKLLQYVSINESVYYYIKPTKGTAIKNGVGSLDLEAHRVTMGVDEVITDGTVQLFIGDTEGGYKKTFDKDAISGSLVVTLKDGVNGSVLDSITLVDVTDGKIGSSAIYGSVSSSGTLTWVQEPETDLNTAGAWSPTSTSVDIVGTYYKEGVAVATKTVPVTRSAAGLLTVGDYTGDEDVTVVVSGGSTPAISIEFTYKNVTVTENLAAIVGAKHGDKGTKGDTGKGVKTQFSVDGTTLWHDEPATNDAYLRTCTNTNGGTWSCGGATKIQGKTGNTGNGVKTQFSADNSSWHDAPATGDQYIRTCTNSNGGTWSCSGSTLIKGETGVKGAKHYYVSGTEWSDTTASNYVKVSQGDALVTWDIVTIYSEANAFSVSKYWDGDSWEEVAEVIDGNLIVDGTVRAQAIDVDDLFAQDITATGTITGGNFVGGKLEVTNEATSTKVTIDSGSDSPIVVNDGNDDVLRFDSSNKLQLSGGLADSTIDNLNMFSPAIWEQIKAPLTEGSTGGAFSGDSVMGGDTLTSKVTMTNVNVNAIALSCRFNTNIFSYQPSTPKWTLTVTARVRSVSGEGNYGSVQNVHSQEYTGTAIVRDDTAFININYAETVSLTGVVSGGDIEFTFTASKVAGLTGSPRLTSLSASQAVSGGGQAGAAVLLDGKNGAYYLNYDNFTNKPTIPANTWRPLGTTSTTAAKGDHVHAWSTITGKPTTFAPSSHTHTEYAASAHTHSGYLTTSGNAASATKLKSILTTFNGEYPITVNVNGTIYSHTGMKFKGADNSLTVAGIINADGGNSNEWNDAVTWGDHADAGYLKSLPSHAHAWSTITGKPTTFAPSSHAHAWSTITGKPTTFSPSSHAHAWSTITGKPTTFAPSSHTHDDRYYTESEVNTFINRSFVSGHSASNLDVGWYTIATNAGDRASARFGIWDVNSSDHQSVTFYAAHHYGTDSSNTLTVLDNSYYSGNPFRYIRIKDAGTYNGAALQIYIDDATNAVNTAILGDNFQSGGWVLCDWIPDATAPPNVSNYGGFGERSKVDLNTIAQGGFATTGEIYAGGDTSQYRVFHDAFHPNADKWTTARTLSLTGDVTGSVSWDGSGNASLSATVADDSHNHTIANIDGLQTALNGKQAAGTYNTVIGTDSDINTSGSTIIDNIYVTDGVITSMGTRTLTAANIGALTTSGKAADSNLLDGIDSGSFLRSDSTDLYSPARLDIGYSGSWDAVGYGSQSNLHFRDHNQFWIGAGNGTWFTGTANSKSQSSGLAADATRAHDLLITTMQSTSTYDRGITFGVDSNGSGTGGWRLGKWHSGDARDASMLAVDGMLRVHGAYTDEYDYYGNDYSTYYSKGQSYWAGDTNAGWHRPSATLSTALQIQSGNSGTNTRKPQIQFHQYGYGGMGLEYDGVSKTFTMGELGTSTQDRVNTFNWRFDNTVKARINSDYMWHNSDMRSPIFYDSNNTGYYVHADNRSVLHSLWCKGSGANSAPRWDTSFHVVQSQHWYGHTSSQTMYLGESGNKVRNRGTLNVGSDADAASGYGMSIRNNLNMHNTDINYVNQLHFNDNVRFYDDGNDNYLNFKWGDTGAGGIKFYDGNNTAHGYLYGDGGGRFGLLDNDGQWAVRIQTGSSPLELRCNDNPEFYVYDSYTYSPGSSRAPIFYDSNDTSYYADPTSTSKFAHLETYKNVPIDVYRDTRGSGTVLYDITSGLEHDAKVTERNGSGTAGSVDAVMPAGCPAAGGKGISITSGYNMYSDYIEVEPGEVLMGEVWARKDTSNTVRFYYGIERFDKDKRPIAGNTGCTYFVAANSALSSSWTKYSAYYTVPTSHTPYGGSDGSGVKYVRVRFLGNYQTSGQAYYAGLKLVRANKNQRTLNDVYTPRTYDINNTGYYVDPASTSNMSVIQMPYRGNGSANLVVNNGGSENWRAIDIDGGNQSHGIGISGTSRSWSGRNSLAFHVNTSDSIRFHSDGWHSLFEVLGGSGEGILRGNLTVGRGQSSSDIFMYDSDGTTRRLHCNSSRIGFLNSSNGWGTYCDNAGNWFSDYSMRAPIFYDSNDTGYYVNPASTSRLNRLDVDIMYDKDNTAYYVRPGSTSILNDARANIFYDRNNTGYYLHADSTSRLNAVDMNSGTLRGSLVVPSDKRGYGMFGTYSSTKTQSIWSMGTAYRSNDSGTNFGNLYGLAYKHTNNGTGGTMAGGHMMVWCQNGTPYAAMGSNIWTSGNVTAYSDRRVKTNLELIPNALEKVQKLNGYTFDRTDVKHNELGEVIGAIRQTGVVAQEVLEVLPEAVTGSEEEHYSVAYGNMVGLLIEAIKEQQTQIEGLSSQIKSLKENNYDNQ